MQLSSIIIVLGIIISIKCTQLHFKFVITVINHNATKNKLTIKSVLVGMWYQIPFGLLYFEYILALSPFQHFNQMSAYDSGIKLLTVAMYNRYKIQKRIQLLCSTIKVIKSEDTKL